MSKTKHTYGQTVSLGEKTLGPLFLMWTVRGKIDRARQCTISDREVPGEYKVGVVIQEDERPVLSQVLSNKETTKGLLGNEDTRGQKFLKVYIIY